MKLPDVASLMTEKTVAVSSDIPALKLGRYLTGIAMEANGAIFPVQSRSCRYFSGSTPLTLQFLRFNAVNTVIFPVKRR